MIKTKLSFGAMIFMLVIIFLGASFFHDYLPTWDISPLTGFSPLGASVPANTVTQYLNYNYSAPAECSFEPPSDKTIVLRVDDLGSWLYFSTVRNMTRDILNRDMSASFAIIPRGLERDKAFADWVRSIKDDERIEFAQHGLNHTPSEFKNLSKEEASAYILEGRNAIISNLGIVPVTFIPPENEYSQGTVDALKEQGFKVMSAKLNEFKKDGDLWMVGLNSRTYDYASAKHVRWWETIEACRRQLNVNNVCVISIHPQDYVLKDNPGVINETLYYEFTRMLDEINTLGIKTATFSDMVVCNPGANISQSQFNNESNGMITNSTNYTLEVNHL